MKDKIEVGEYVRTEIDTIGKVKTIHNAGSGVRYYGEDLYKNYYTIDYDEGNTYGRFNEDGIIKHSENIIDLIEVGDYVNGSLVENTYLEGMKHYIKLENRDKTKVFENRIYNEDIKSIVTKEQFKEMEYRV